MSKIAVVYIAFCVFVVSLFAYLVKEYRMPFFSAVIVLLIIFVLLIIPVSKNVNKTIKDVIKSYNSSMHNDKVIEKEGMYVYII